jgi:hypothetical protein
LLRVISPDGVSPPLLVLIDGLPALPATKGNFSPEEAQTLEPPIAVDGIFSEGKRHYFRVALKQAQHLAIELIAYRLGWNADPVLRVLDPSGTELVYAGDTPGLGSDCAVDFVAPRAAEYLLELRDAEYAGGPDRRYRLRLGQFPVAALPVVPTVTTNQRARVAWESTVSGRAGSARARARRSAPTPTARMLLGGPLRDEALTPRLWVDSRSTYWESEPNDSRESAPTLEITNLVYGRFGKSNDVDWFRLEIPESGRWKFQVLSRSLGFACDPLMRLTDDQGTPLPASSSSELDPALHFAFETAGTYYLSLREAASRHGPGRAYVLALDPTAAGFDLSAENDRVHVPVGGAATLKLTIDRKGYSGPLALSAAGLGPGFTLEDSVVESDKKEWRLRIRCAATIEPGTWHRVSLQGTPAAGKALGATILSLRPALRKHLPRLLALPPRLAEELWVCAVPPTEDGNKEDAAD